MKTCGATGKKRDSELPQKKKKSFRKANLGLWFEKKKVQISLPVSFNHYIYVVLS